MKSQPSINKARFGSILVALAVHVVLIFLLLLAKFSIPRPNPVSIVASRISQTHKPIIHECPSPPPRPAAEAPPSLTPVVAFNISACSIPEFSDSNVDLTMALMPEITTVLDMGFSTGQIFSQQAIPSTMRSRCSMSERMKRIRQSGGPDRAETSVRKGLQYLDAQQNKETGAFGTQYPVAMTGLTLMAYLGHCETPESPKFGDSVVKAALYLMDRALKNEGLLISAEGKGDHHSTYEHPIAVYALCELYTITKSSSKEIPRIESILKKSVRKIVDAQDSLGGWSYGFDGSSGVEDMSVSGWMIQALKAAHNTGLNIRGVDQSLDKAVNRYLPKIQDANGAFKYRPDDANGKSTLTAAALLGMQMWNQTDSANYKRGMAYLEKTYRNPSLGRDYYTPYYNTQAFFLHGGTEWENYNEKFHPILIDAQNSDGSWTTSLEGRAKEDSVIMNTAWAILMLEVYYRYLPTTDKIDAH